MNMNKNFVPALMGMALSMTMLVQAAAAGTAPLPAADKDAAEVLKKISPSVVRIEVQDHVRRVATGVVMDKDGYIVTTALAYPRGGTITVFTVDGRQSDAEFVGLDVETRLAVIKAKDRNLVPIVSGKVEEIAVGSWVCVLGVSPEGAPSVSQGIVSSYVNDRLRLNAWVTPGSSGGPVVNDKGRMIGLLRGIYTEDRPVVFSFRDKEQTGMGYVVSQAEAPSSGMALAVPVDVVMNVYSQIKEKGRVERGWLGVGVTMSQDGIMVISAIDGKSPADKVDLKEGDVILAIDGREIRGPDSLAAAIRNKKPGDGITMSIDRGGKKSDVKVNLGEYTDDEARKELETRFPRLFGPEPGPGGPGGMPPGGPENPGKMPQGGMAPGQPPQAPVFEKRRYIGVYCDELTKELAGHFGVKEGRALMVSKLTEGGPALKADIRVGDIIIRIDGRKIETQNEMIDVLQGRKKGDKVKVELIREKKTLTREVVIGEDETRGLMSDGSFGDYLDSLGYSMERFGQEAVGLPDEFLTAFQENMKKINDDLARQVQADDKTAAKAGAKTKKVKKV